MLNTSDLHYETFAVSLVSLDLHLSFQSWIFVFFIISYVTSKFYYVIHSLTIRYVFNNFTIFVSVFTFSFLPIFYTHMKNCNYMRFMCFSAGCYFPSPSNNASHYSSSRIVHHCYYVLIQWQPNQKHAWWSEGSEKCCLEFMKQQVATSYRWPDVQLYDDSPDFVSKIPIWYAPVPSLLYKSAISRTTETASKLSWKIK